MNKRRLLKLADLLEADAKNKTGVKFDLGTVGMDSRSGHVEFQPALNCGTTACAMGLAAISGEFKRAGLSFSIHPSLNEIDTTINGRVVQYDKAASITFGITRGEADFLFTPSWYGNEMPRGAKGERRVAKRIRDFVAGKFTKQYIAEGAPFA